MGKNQVLKYFCPVVVSYCFEVLITMTAYKSVLNDFYCQSEAVHSIA